MSLYFSIFLLNLRMLTVYKKDFYFGVISSILKVIVSILFIDFLFINFEVLENMNLNEVKYLYFSIGLIQSIINLFFLGLIDFSNLYIRKGDLDIVLLKPVNKIIFIIISNIDIKSIPDTILHLVILISIILKISGDLISSIVLFLLPIIGIIFFISFSFIINSLSFKFKDTLMANRFIISTTELCRYPLSIYPKIINIILLLFLPFGLTNYYPILNFDKIYFVFCTSFIFSLLFYSFSYIIFIKSFTKYESTGS